MLFLSEPDAVSHMLLSNVADRLKWMHHPLMLHFSSANSSMHVLGSSRPTNSNHGPDFPPFPNQVGFNQQGSYVIHPDNHEPYPSQVRIKIRASPVGRIRGLLHR